MPLTTAVRTAAELEAALRTLGFRPGRPPSYSPMSAAVDRSAARRLVCPKCRRRGLGLKHFHRGESVRCVACCPSCGFAEEV